MPENPENDDARLEKIVAKLDWLRRRTGHLTVAIMLMALALFLTVSVAFGRLVEYHAFEPLLVGSVAFGAAVLGFLFGFVAGRWR